MVCSDSPLLLLSATVTDTYFGSHIRQEKHSLGMTLISAHQNLPRKQGATEEVTLFLQRSKFVVYIRVGLWIFSLGITLTLNEFLLRKPLHHPQYLARQ